MGNNSSGQTNKESTYNVADYPEEFYAIDENQYSRMVEDINEDVNINVYEDVYNESEKIYKKISENRKMESLYDPVHNLSLPYESDTTYLTGQKYESIPSSDNPKYIEFVVCRGNLEDIRERYAVHKSAPEHKCCKNCPCIEKFLEIDANTGTIRRDLSEKRRLSNRMLSETSDAPVDYNMNFSPTSTDSYTNDSYTNRNAATRRDTMVGKMPYKSFVGGANDGDDVSPEEITESEEEPFSATSEMSLTTTTTISPEKKKKKKKKEDSKEKESEEEETTTTTTETEDDEDDEDLEVLQLEEDTEGGNGHIFETSDIGSSELYRIQKRFFNSSDDMDNIDGGDIEDDDRELTEEVREAYDKMNSRKNIFFDSEDKDILDINSSTDKYIKKPGGKNDKYN
ncbi:MAG: hypothetical protein Satyrvirus4_14 [Satyrvirus sp.]|uniref:Uncharacterized protein n=1 Tax=Satyrvirus sp. TaxID=2487771 RepID=A0A3G5AD79_9VIRU|nr:MAG: hypothetical protein Satyrvirus4_14 [Satyrvirus sp.]